MMWSTESESLRFYVIRGTRRYTWDIQKVTSLSVDLHYVTFYSFAHLQWFIYISHKEKSKIHIFPLL